MSIISLNLIGNTITMNKCFRQIKLNVFTRYTIDGPPTVETEGLSELGLGPLPRLD